MDAFRVGLAYLTGLGQIVCGLAILFSLYPRAAALIETLMLAFFALLVWVPILAFGHSQVGRNGARSPVSLNHVSYHMGQWRASALLIANNCSTARLGSLTLRRPRNGRCRETRTMLTTP